MRFKVLFPFWSCTILYRRGPLHGYGITAQIESISDLVCQSVIVRY
jgi:hypothetical protein